jgi:HEAT repeat protein
MMGAHAELRQLYQNADIDLESRLELLKAMGMGGDVEGLAQIAKTEKDPVVRRHAIKDLGIFGGHSASDALVSIYGSEDNIETKKTVINALFLSGAGKQMVFLARKETNPELKSALTQKMSLMSSPEITQYMLEILNK